jgi:hypothetical protein
MLADATKHKTSSAQSSRTAGLNGPDLDPKGSA